ncbi:metal ABC transporter substrate-binding protein [Simkania sp.]|uniref:metal ABC transporter substrate-binding protein n=1 Tax=Simkania sp. TaxID=34094 RepID=UPI003B5229B3
MKKYFLLTFAFLSIVVALVGCRTKFEGKVGDKPSVLVSVPPYISIVQAIAGDTVTVESAVSPGFDSHNNEITPSQAKKIQTCDLWIGIGEPYERKLLASLREAKREVRVLQINETINLISYEDDVNFVDACADVNLPDRSAQDLHFWMSPMRLVYQAQRIYEALAAMSPKHATLYQDNLKKYIDRIKAVDLQVTEKLKPFRKKGVIVSHAFLGYLCYDYNMYQIAVECEGKSPRAVSVNRVLTLAKNYDVQCVFTLPQHNNKGALLVAEKLKLKTYEVDPLDPDPLKTIQTVVNDITSAK